MQYMLFLLFLPKIACVLYISFDMTPFYDNFLMALEERYPDKPNRVNALMNLLKLEKESIYRRLRKDVYFAAEEVMRIAAAWNISLDNIVAVNREKTRPFRLKTVEFIDPSEEDYAIMERHNRDMALVASDPNGLAVEVVNGLPRGLYARSEHLTRFFNMKWRHKHSPEKALNFSDVQIPERMKELDREYIRISHRISEMHSIHDSRMIEHLVEEIVYYRSIGMVSGDDVLLLREELLTLVDYLEEVTGTGIFPEKEGKIFFYLSHTWVDNEYFLYRSHSFNMSLVKVLERNYLASMDKRVLDRFMKTALAARRMSVLMSGSNVLQQAEFFSLQREKIRSL
jgi:hypothetical protein